MTGLLPSDTRSAELGVSCLILALRILRSSADAQAVLASLDRARGGNGASPSRRQDVTRECLAVLDRRMLGGQRFGRREVRRYQREITQYLPDTDVDVEVALSTLPDRARIVLILHDHERFTLREIAELLEIAPTAARWYLHRARTLVRLYLDHVAAS